jgi:SAM-dependent methyltransferase
METHSKQQAQAGDRRLGEVRSLPARDDSAGASAEFVPLYEGRFDEGELRFKADLWRVLVAEFFQSYIEPGATLVELGAGGCEFINAVRCARKIAVDLNPRTADLATDAEVLLRPSDDLSPIASETVDVVFASNFFEHMESKAALLATLRECRRIVRPGGKLIVLQPNIRYVGGRYWDYLDHHIPLTHLSMAEALELSGFSAEEVVPRFLPYTVKDRRFPHSVFLVRAYLKLRPAWRIFGRQMLLVGVRR